MTSRMTPLLEHNEQFARTFTPVPLGLPTAQVILITCLDHRVDPALTLGLRLGDAPVLRNAGGRVTQPGSGLRGGRARTGRPPKPPPSPTRTSPSPPTSSACSPHPCSRRR